MTPTFTVTVLWAVWYVTWIAAVVFSGKTKVQMRTDMVGLHRMIGSFGFIFLFAPVTGSDPAWWPMFTQTLTTRLWSESQSIQWTLFAAVLAGFAFCWWARLHLGRLWSGLVTLKEDHHIVDTGPYGLVRHPIYSGVMFAALMTGLLKATPAGLLGFILVALGFAWVARIEERFLSAHLGEAVYDDYSRRVAMLVPGLKTR